MTSERPDPDEILTRLRDSERKGKLRVFLGAAPGVGKTYAMLQAAQIKRAEGESILIGYVETHGRIETEALLKGLEVLPPKETEHRGVKLKEFDLDAALALRPTTILVDELAHSNAPGSRNLKRWQDVEELLERGINVWTTVNVQHIESLSDAASRVAGTLVRELVPNAILERADALQVIDIAPDELIERLKAGKVYVPDTVDRALQNFFRLDRLTALREMALRQAAQKADAQLDERAAKGLYNDFAAGERILVSVGAGPYSARLIRSAKVMAERLRAVWYAVSVETPEHAAFTADDRERISQNLHLARRLGAEVHVLSGERVSETLLSFARERRVTRIIIGKPLHSRWKDLLKGSLLDEVIRGSGDIDVLVITGDKINVAQYIPQKKKSRPVWVSYLVSFGVVSLATALNIFLKPHLEMSDFALIFLLAVVLCSFRFGFGPAAFAAILSTAAFDFVFVPPFYTFSVANPMHLLTFGVMLTVSFVVASLAQRARVQTASARLRERQTWMLYSFTEKLAFADSLYALSVLSINHLEKYFKGKAVLFLPKDGKLEPSPPRTDVPIQEGTESGVVAWVKENGKPAGRGTGTFSGIRGTYYPVSSSSRVAAVLGLWFDGDDALADSDSVRLLEAHAHQLGLAIERFMLEDEARRRRLEAEAEVLRSTLLSSVSHDLRTPLATIIGSATTQLAFGRQLPESNRDELNQAILDEAERMNRLVGNLLDMTRIETKALVVKKELLPVDEVIGSALRRMEKRLARHQVLINLGDAPIFLWADGALIEQLLVNLLDNAVKYADKGTSISIFAAAKGGEITLSIEDQGPGFSAEELDRVFERFFRGDQAAGKPGSGLGLAICKGIVQAHGGSICAENVETGGARFVIRLPNTEAPDIKDELWNLENPEAD